MSSHREAPEISKDPCADSTDLYAFVSPENNGTVTLIANYIPLEPPDSGPNFYEFDDNIVYSINVDNNGDGVADIVYQFTFATTLRDPSYFLYNVGPITSLGSANWNRVQTYTLRSFDRWGGATLLGTGLPCPPCNVGPLSTPDYAALADAAVSDVGNGIKAFAGQRAEGFYVDLGAVFDLGNLRPFQGHHAGWAGTGLPAMAAGVNSTAGVNVHTLALQVPMDQLTSNGQAPTSQTGTIGVWTTASRQQVRIIEEGDGDGDFAWLRSNHGPFMQVSRLGNPLFNEVLIPLSTKDYWNTQPPSSDSQFAGYVSSPQLAALLPGLFPGLFTALAGYSKPRADLLAILLTGIPSGVVPGFVGNYTGAVQADLLRLNMTIPPTPTAGASNLGVVAGDFAGYPNGRRVFDDVVTIELRAIAGLTIPLVDHTYTPDTAAGEISMGLTSGPSDLAAMGTENYLSTFPYLGLPYSGYAVPA
jgi:hypothetical protein